VRFCQISNPPIVLWVSRFHWNNMLEILCLTKNVEIVLHWIVELGCKCWNSHHLQIFNQLDDTIFVAYLPTTYYFIKFGLLIRGVWGQKFMYILFKLTSTKKRWCPCSIILCWYDHHIWDKWCWNFVCDAGVFMSWID
jgi:hypothetical protein